MSYHLFNSPCPQSLDRLVERKGMRAWEGVSA